MANKDSTVVSVRLELPNLRKLAALAKVNNTSVGELIRTAVKEYLDKKLSDQNTYAAIRKAKEDFESMMKCLLEPRT